MKIVEIPEVLHENETYMFRDLALGMLFPEYWSGYVGKCSKENVFKVLVVYVADDLCNIELMEISPVEGRVILPSGIRNVVNKRTFDVAFYYSRKDMD